MASADSRTQTYDIWNLTSTALNITGYENAKDYNKVPADKLPQAKVIPLGKNFQITIAIGQGVITSFAGSQPAQQGVRRRGRSRRSSKIWIPFPPR